MTAISALSRLRARVSGLGRWLQRLLAFTLGAILVFAMAPTYQLYVLLISLSGLLWLIDAQPTRWRAFALGWWFGAGFFAVGLYWVSFALLVQADRFAWLIPFAVFGFAFGLGLFTALAALVTHMARGPLWTKALVLVGAWTILEWVRTWVFTGFPWNSLGESWLVSITLAQGAAVVGVLGMSFLAALIGVLPAVQAEPNRVSWGMGIAAMLAVVALIVGGEHRLANAQVSDQPNVQLRLVQPNIRQVEKWDPALRDRHMEDQMALSLVPPAPDAPKPTHIVWSETAAPFFLVNNAKWFRRMADAAPEGGLMIVGAPRTLVYDSVSNRSAELRVANSLLAIDAGARLVATYDKFHLVPFGEYVPLSDVLPLDKITQGAGAFHPGPGPATLDLAGLPPVSPLICYEIIFPGQVTDNTGRAQWILNLTNDAWYGKTAGPHQHFATARLRAIEEGIPVVRVAGSGISGIIDAYGRVRASLGLGERGVVDGPLPGPARRPPLFVRTGHGIALGLATLSLLGGLIFARRFNNLCAE